MRLEGNRSVLALSVVESVLVVSLLLAAALTLNFGLQDIADPSLYYVAIVAVSLVGLATVTWFVSGVVAFRYGRFSVRADHVSGDLIRNYLRVTAVIALALGAWALFSVPLHPVGMVILASWVGLPPLVYISLAKRGRQPAVAALVGLLAWAGTVNGPAIALNVYSFANYPEERPFTEQLWVSRYFGSETRAWTLLGTLTDDLRGDEAASEQQRTNILALLEQTIVSPPRDGLFIGSEVPDFAAVEAISDAELGQIRGLLTDGNSRTANTKYIRLWKVAENLVSSRSVMVQYLVGMEISSDLIAFYLDDDNSRLLSNDAELRFRVESVRDRLDSGFVGAITREYLTLRKSIADRPSDVCQGVPRGLCIFGWPWPVYDVNKTLKVEHDQFVDLVSLGIAPFHQVERGLKAYEDEAERTNQVSLLKNPVGSVVLSLGVPVWLTRFVCVKERTSASLAVFLYALDSQNAGVYGTPPVDPLTGEPFTVTDSGASVTIESTYIRDGGPAVQYEIGKTTN